MRTIFLTLFISFFIGFLNQTDAATYNPDNLPIPYLQDRTKHVINPDNILSTATTAQMDSMLYRLEKEKGVQSLAIVVESIEGGDCYDFAITLGNKYGIGNKENTGLIILLATKDRCYQILTGEGLEGTLPDAICRRIENRRMVPFLKKSLWDEAMLHTTEAVCGIILDDASLVNTPIKQNSKTRIPAVFTFLGLFLGIMILSWYKNKKRNSCPFCGKSNIYRIDSQITIDKLQFIEHHKETFRCSHCGKTFTRTHDEPWDNGSGFGGFPPIAGPFHRGFGSSFGGDFNGGSFGGGSFGGGGSGGRF